MKIYLPIFSLKVIILLQSCGINRTTSFFDEIKADTVKADTVKADTVKAGIDKSLLIIAENQLITRDQFLEITTLCSNKGYISIGDITNKELPITEEWNLDNGLKVRAHGYKFINQEKMGTVPNSIVIDQLISGTLNYNVKFTKITIKDSRNKKVPIP